jgi:hypothetical protein
MPAIPARMSRIRVWKMIANVTQRCGTQNGIRQCMQNDVRITMTGKANIMVYSHSTQNEIATSYQSMGIVADAHTKQIGIRSRLTKHRITPLNVKWRSDGG